MDLRAVENGPKTALFLQSWGKGPGPFKRGTFPKLGKKSYNEQKVWATKKTPKNEIVKNKKTKKKTFLFFTIIFLGIFFQKLGKNIYFLDRGMGPKYGPKLAIKKA